MNNKRIIVLAGNRQEFENFLDDNGLTDSEAVYAFEPSSVLGIQASDVIDIGTFWERKDASDLYKLAKTCIF